MRRLQSYFPVIEALVKNYSKTNPGQIFAGDKQGFNYFKVHHLTLMNPETGQQGIFYLHPNTTGSKQLGHLWGKAIVKATLHNRQ